MKRRRLDQGKAFGNVTPPFMGAVSYQDGIYFDPSGNELFTSADDTDEKREASLKRWAEQEEKAAKMRQAKSEKANDEGALGGTEDTTMPDGAGDPDPVNNGSGEKTVDLAAWAKKEAKYSWFEVAAQIKKQFDIVVPDKQHAIPVLIENGIVTADEVKV